ncbi:hypothetical protein D210916BOD24_31670 [Alteromonas sp. D210916BOD_24]|uniref:hypothetical protein n=1 Tax=Alteromonas sp. D210916BOD_24 TaxID=3157618 RepID=UPI00399D191A
MTSVNNASLNNAFIAGQYGLQSASNGIDQAASNIAQRTVESTQTLSSSNTDATPDSLTGSVTDDLISLKVNEIHGQASARVLDVANDTLGTIIDIKA